GVLFLFGQGFVLAYQVDHLVDTAAQHNVGTATCHVGGNGDVPRLAGFSDDLGFTRVLLRVKHFVRELVLLQQSRQALGVLDTGGTHQHRLPALVAIPDIGHDGVEFFDVRLVDLIVLVVSRHGPV